MVTLRPKKKSSIKIKMLMVIFDFKIERREIPAFRAAVVEKVGRENTLFHNHLEQQQFLYGYPLIQYKTVRGNPAIICINEGSEEILKFFKQVDWDLLIHGKKVETEIRNISFDYVHCGILSEQLRYRINNWFALNKSNFANFIELDNDRDKIEFLQRILIGNILTFAKGIEWNIDGQIKLIIPALPKRRFFSFKDHQMVGFDLDFITNIALPNSVGLGKSVSRGFGMIGRIGQQWNRQN
ncbi:MAG: CRISPR-associated endonuclease Cas6 [Desulfobacteraceae bacterium]|nr:CRISPR-associated endonuclease Cas6 [Desulfobacteraceae bacterium]